MKRLSVGEQLDIIEQHGGAAIYYFANPSEVVQLTAVKQNGYAIKFIKNPSEVVQLAAVGNNGYAIRHIKNPSEAVQLAAIGNNKLALRWVINPTQLAIRTTLTDQRLIDDYMFYEDVVKKLFKDNSLLMNKWLRYGKAMRS
jgi:hypothetical protein